MASDLPFTFCSIELMYYKLLALLHIGSDEKIEAFLLSFSNLSQIKLKPSDKQLFSASQQLAITQLLVYEQLSLFKVNSTHILNKRYIVKLQKSISNDSFLIFLKKLNFNQLNTLIAGPKFFNFFLKLIIFSSLINKMIQLKIETPALINHKKLCDDYFNIIFNHHDIMIDFIEHFHKNTTLDMGIKLFIIDVFFKEMPSPFPMAHMLTLLEKNWFKNHFYDHDNIWRRIEFLERYTKASRTRYRHSYIICLRQLFRYFAL